MMASVDLSPFAFGCSIAPSVPERIGWAVSKLDNTEFAYHEAEAGVAQLVEQRSFVNVGRRFESDLRLPLRSLRRLRVPSHDGSLTDTGVFRAEPRALLIGQEVPRCTTTAARSPHTTSQFTAEPTRFSNASRSRSRRAAGSASSARTGAARRRCCGRSPVSRSSTPAPSGATHRACRWATCRRGGTSRKARACSPTSPGGPPRSRRSSSRRAPVPR